MPQQGRGRHDDVRAHEQMLDDLDVRLDATAGGEHATRRDRGAIHTSEAAARRPWTTAAIASRSVARSMSGA